MICKESVPRSTKEQEVYFDIEQVASRLYMSNVASAAQD
ncbi:unnamed protein product [Amoebophrya sp. A25]|nr:unnamed protein product [Amoebophrya sp. A25]|eukprot:GSA25T00022144001.1